MALKITLFLSTFNTVEKTRNREGQNLTNLVPHHCATCQKPQKWPNSSKVVPLPNPFFGFLAFLAISGKWLRITENPRCQKTRKTLKIEVFQVSKMIRILNKGKT